MKLKKVGMRNIKTALSVVICVALSQYFNRQYIFYAAIAAVMAMQSSVSDSFKVGKNRMLGTIVGAIIGLLCALLNPDNVILCGIGIVVVIYICDLLEWQKSVPISCTVFLIIMLSLNGRPPVAYSVNRTMDTFLGITVAVLVNYFISPPKHLDKVYEERKIAIEKIFNIVENKLCHNKDIDLKDLDSEILKLEDVVNTYLSELRVKNQQVLGIDKIKEILHICKDIHMHLRIIKSLEGEYSLNEENYEQVRSLFKHEFVVDKETNDMNIVFNYHVSKVIEGMCLLRERRLKVD